MLEKIKNTTEFILKKINFKPQIGIVLGTGLGGLVNEIEIKYSLPYQDIPNFPVSTVESHHGELIFGILGGKNVVAMHGRFHYYEGYDMKQVTFPVRIMKMLGIEKLILSNACGGLNPAFEVSDLMIITDHINLLPANPLVGKNLDELGPRFPDMSSAYDKEIISKAIEIARKNNIKFQTGVYASVTGPNLETPAEYKFLRIIGADVVGMSTIPEVIVARQMNIPCFAISIVTDLGVEGKIKETSLDEIIAAAAKAEPKMTLIIKELIRSL